jgi:hypothetical protein
MILDPNHKKFTGPLQIKVTVKKYLMLGAICPYQGLLNAITLR